MRRLTLIHLFLLAAIGGCMPEPTPQEKYDDAVKSLERAEARLDNLRPAYDAARQKAALKVCEEIAGTTPEQSAADALSNLEGLLTGAATDPATEGAPAGDAKKPAAPLGDADAALDQLMDAHKQMQEKTAELTGPINKARETMKLINTPGTPEAKQVDELVAKMPEAKAYLRQEKRVETLQKAVDDAEAMLSGDAAVEPVK
ncbi:MAG: hypothetical protein AB7G28_04540 [Pirellulales bacterium]